MLLDTSIDSNKTLLAHIGWGGVLHTCTCIHIHSLVKSIRVQGRIKVEPWYEWFHTANNVMRVRRGGERGWEGERGWDGRRGLEGERGWEGEKGWEGIGGMGG